MNRTPDSVTMRLICSSSGPNPLSRQSSSLAKAVVLASNASRAETGKIGGANPSFRVAAVKVLEEWDRQIALRHLGRNLDRLVLRAVAKDVNAISRRKDIYFGEWLSEERVKQG